MVCILVVACNEGGLQGRSDAGGDGQAAARPQGAVTFKVGVMPGNICSQTSAQMSAPANIAGVLGALTCDLSTGCKPDEYVVVDRDRGTTVQCTVAPNGDMFNVSVRLSVDGTSTGGDSISFELNGLFSPMGGTALVSEQNSPAHGAGSDTACHVIITPPRGLVKPGAIWGTVECDNFRNALDISETGCTLTGTFLFENCAG